MNYYAAEVYRILRDLCAAVPHGILVFFASYRIMNEFIQRWQRQLRSDPNFFYGKQVFVEGRLDLDFEAQLRRYREAARGPYGAVYLAAARGKIARECDFPDNEARAVVFIGIPYKSNRSLPVSRKRAFNDEMHNNYEAQFVTSGPTVIHHVNPYLTGDEWYGIDAFRTMSQAIGRVIRHANDWSVLLFIEHRLSHEPFHASQFNHYLPEWVRRSGVRLARWQWMKTQIGQFCRNMMEEINL
jgi:Rad3-related DNA helicase